MASNFDKNKEFSEIQALHYDKIYRLVLRRLRMQSEAAEATNETFARAFSYWDQFKGNSETSTWLVRIATNLTTYIIKRRAIRLSRGQTTTDSVAHDLADSGYDLEREYEKLEREKAVAAALDTLPPDQLVAVKMFFFEGLGYKEIATELGISPGTVASRIARAKDTLKFLLEEWKGDDD